MSRNSPDHGAAAPSGNDVPEDRQIELLATFDEALANGVALEGAASLDLDAAEQQRLAENQQCLQLLEQLFPRRRAEQGNDRPAAEVGLPLGQPLGRFTLLRELGRGGFGVVYLAEDPALCRQVALKVPRANVFLTPELRERFLREAKSAGRLNHPNLVRVLDAGQAGLLCYIVSDYCPGPTLAAWLKTNGACRPLMAARIVAAVARAVAYIHSQGILHRDIKPSNILLVPADEGVSPGGDLPFTPRLTDFGLARLIDAECTETASGTILGTPAYMAPEQAHGRVKEAGSSADVYSLGAVLYELCTGQPPFGGSSLAVLAQVISADIVPPRQLRPEVPRDLEAICLKCLERNPDRRYPTAEALAADLENYIAGRPTVARPAPFWKRGLNSARRRPALMVGVALGSLMLLCAALGGSWFWHQQNIHRTALSVMVERDQQQTVEIRQRSDERDTLQREHEYAHSIRLAAACFRDERAATMGDFLNPLRPAANEEDVREFAWHYLWRQAGRMTILRGNEHRARAIVFADDGLLSASIEGQLHHWDVATRRLRGSTSIGAGYMTFSADGARLASFTSKGKSQGHISYRNARTGAMLAELDLPVDIYQLAMAPDGRRIAVGTALNLDSTAAAMLAGDVNGDGRGDVVYIERLSGLGVVVSAQLSCPDESWASVTSFVHGLGDVLASPPLLGDVNGDARADLVFTKFDSVAGILAVHTSTAGLDGVFGPTVQTSLPCTSTISDRPLLLGDIDGDGRMDLIFARYDRIVGKTIVETGAGQREGTFGPWVHAVLDDHLFDLPALVGDINGDGLTDLITISRRKGQGPFVRTAISRGDGSFHTPGETLLPDGDKLPSKPLFLAGDVNDDRKADLIIAWYDAKRTLTVLRTAASLGDGAFAGTILKILRQRPFLPLRPGDINGDGLTDLIFDRREDERGLIIRTITARGDGAFHNWVQTVFGRGRAVVMLWEPATGRTEVVWENKTVPATVTSPHEGRPSAFRFAPDGNRLAVAFKPPRPPGQTVDDWACEIVDLSTRKTAATLLNGPAHVSALAFSPDGRLLAIAGAQHWVKVWDLEMRQQRSAFFELDFPVACLAFSPDGNTLAAGMSWPGWPTGVKNKLGLWDLTTGARYEQPSCRGFEIVSLAFAADGKTLALGCEDDTLRLCDLTDIPEFVSWPAHAHSEAWGIAFAPDRAVFATSGDDHLCKLWDLDTRQEIARCAGAPSLLLTVAYAPDRPLLATAGYDGAIRLFSADTGEEQAVLAGHQGPVRSLAFSPQGELLASAGDDMTVKLWNPLNGELVSSLTGHIRKVRAVVFTPDGKTLFSGGNDELLKQWKSETGECLQTFAGSSDIESLAHSPQGPLLAVGRTDGDVELRDSVTGEIQRRFKGHTQGVRSVAFSPDGKSLASGGLDNTVRLWHLATGQELLCFDELPQQINGVALSADGRTLGATCHDGSVWLWKVAAP